MYTSLGEHPPLAASRNEAKPVGCPIRRAAAAMLPKHCGHAADNAARNDSAQRWSSTRSPVHHAPNGLT